MLQDGLYEQIISNAIDGAITAEPLATDKQVETARIDEAEASKMLAQCISEILQQAPEGLDEAEKLFSANMFERGVSGAGIARVRSKGDEALFGGITTSGMKKRLGVPDRKPLADHLPRVTMAAKQLATELTNFNIENQDMHGEAPITVEHVQNNSDVRELLGRRGVIPENLPAEEDVKKLERKVRSDEHRLEQDVGFPASITE